MLHDAIKLDNLGTARAMSRDTRQLRRIEKRMNAIKQAYFKDPDQVIFPVVVGKSATWRLVKAVRPDEMGSPYYEPMAFQQWPVIMEQAQALSHRYEDLMVFTDNRLRHRDFRVTTYGSAGLAVFLALYGRLIGKRPLRVAATGVVERTLLPNQVPDVLQVNAIHQKLSMLIQEAPFLGIDAILFPKANQRDADEFRDMAKQAGIRLVPVDNVKTALDVVFPNHGALHAARSYQLVRAMEAARFVAPYDPDYQAMILKTGYELLHDLNESNDPGMDQVIVSSVVGHYHVHRGESEQAAKVLKAGLETAQGLLERNDPWLDRRRMINILNILAILHSDTYRLTLAEAYCGQALNLGVSQGEEVQHCKGTLGQVLSAFAAVLHVLGKHEQAMDKATKAIELHSKLQEISRNSMDRARQLTYLANALTVAGRFGEAEKVLQQLQGLDGAMPEFTMLARANLAFRTGDFRPWLDACEKICPPFETLRPDRRFDWPNMGLGVARMVAWAAIGDAQRADQLFDLFDSAPLPAKEARHSLMLIWALAIRQAIYYGKIPQIMADKWENKAKDLLNTYLPGDADIVTNLTGPALLL